jgi:hypothetical protein
MPSKHYGAAQLIRRGLYDDLLSFAQLENRISLLSDENTKVVCDAFEVFVEGYLATHQKLRAETVWFVGQIPPDIRQQLNLPKDAKGIVAKQADNFTSAAVKSAGKAAPVWALFGNQLIALSDSITAWLQAIMHLAG